MAYNYLGLVNAVNNRLNEVELTGSNFASATGFYANTKNAVNNAIRDISLQEFEWPFNHNTQETALVASTVRYSLPSDCKTVDMETFRIKKNTSLGNDTVKLKVLSYEEYLERFVDVEYAGSAAATGVPEYVVRTPSREFALYPAPDKAYTVVYEYYSTFTPLSAYTDVPTLPDQFEGAIVEGAMYYSYFFRGETENAQLSLRKFEKDLKALQTLYINRYEYLRSTVIEKNI